jgi:hypothetical protein
VVPPNTQELIDELRDQLRALDLAIATFERLAALREQQDPPPPKKQKIRKTARARPSASLR